MTKKEFNEYIESFQKEAGTYTDEEIFAIGVAHKSLLHVDKNWNELSKRLGLGKSGEALRNWIKYRQLVNNTLPKNTRILTDKKIEEVTMSDVSKALEEKTHALYVQQTKTRDTLNYYRRVMREEARIDLFKQGLLDAISQLDELPEVKGPFPTLSAGKKEAILMFSDLHLGVDCNNFYNKYNDEIAVKRVSRLVDRTIKYCKANDISRLTVINMGDMVHGIIHTNARIEASLSVTEQIIKASEIISQALNRLQECASEVIYRSVVDNHARAVANKHEHIEKENFNKIIDWFVEERLKDSKINFMHDNLDDGLGAFTLLNGKTVMFAHGHQDTMDNVFQHFVGATEKFFHYVLLSHYHTEKMKTYQGVKIFINGSIVGTEEYALSKRLFNKPAQKLLIFESDSDDVLDISIDLDL